MSLEHIGSLVKSNLIHRIPSALKGIPNNDRKKLPNYLCEQIIKYPITSISFWNLAEKLAGIDYKYAQGLLMGVTKKNYKNYKYLFLKSCGSQFKNIFKAYCSQEADIRDIISCFLRPFIF